MKVKKFTRIAAGAAVALCLSGQVQAGGGTMIDNDMLLELKRMIEQQQTQLDKQAAEIAALKEQLSGNTEVPAAKADREALKDTDRMATSSYSNVNVSLYGQFNPALLYADNGDSSKWYVVDNTHSQTRIGLRANIETGSGWSAGGRFETGISNNPSDDVNSIYTNDSVSEVFVLRWAEISFTNDEFGKISLGKGDSASNNTAEVDLSGTAVAMQDKTRWAGSATLLYDSSTGLLSDIEVKDIFDGFDGLSRTDRIRYDTPSFGGLTLAGSASSGDAFDGSIFYSRKFSGTKVAAAIGAANPGDIIPFADRLYTGSASVLLPMGFNATFSSAYIDKNDDNLDNATFWWGKLGYLTQFYSNSSTAFSIDYGEMTDLRVNDEKGNTWALAAVHNVNDWATEFYAIYRMYKAESDNNDFDDVNIFMTGARLKF